MGAEAARTACGGQQFETTSFLNFNNGSRNASYDAWPSDIGTRVTARSPRRLSNVMKWISCYMSLSRVRNLREFRCIGLTKEIRELIDLGPPEGFLTRFLKVFEEKAARTQKDIEDVLVELGWNDQEA